MSCRIGFAGRDPITGVAVMAPIGKNCQRGGKVKKRKTRSKKRKASDKLNKNKNRNSKRNSSKKISQKRLNLVIDKLCSKMKRRCTPKYKSLLKKIVMNHL